MTLFSKGQHGFLRPVLAALLLLASGTAALAQSYRGRVQGVITDPTQAVIANANVTLLNIATGVTVVRQSSDTGLYLFDLVEPGSYTVTVEAAGFNKFIQENVAVQMRGDVTVNASLNPGTVQESITVTESPVQVQFNSSNKDFTLDSRLVQEIPRIDRNPFKLTLLAPSAVNTRGEMMPYHSWAANSVDLGGGTNLKNDLQVDGSSINVGHKNTYPPNTDAVQEVVVSQNSVDSESGHSAGGLISLTLKSGIANEGTQPLLRRSGNPVGQAPYRQTGEMADASHAMAQAEEVVTEVAKGQAAEDSQNKGAVTLCQGPAWLRAPLH